MAGISGINNNNSMYTLTQLLNNQSSASTSEVDSLTSLVGTDTVSENSANSVIFSTQGVVYNRLQQLQKPDPIKFKQVCAEIAAELTAASKKNAGTSAAELAAKFVSAAETGKMTDLTATTTTDTTSSTESSKIPKAKNVLAQYYQQYSTSQSSGNADMASVIQSILDSLGSSI